MPRRVAPKKIAKKTAAPVELAPEPQSAATFPVVGVGASAGGLESFANLLRALPADPGAAFIYVVHLDPKQPAVVPRTIERATTMKVVEAADGTIVEPNIVYVAPPSTHISIDHGVLRIERLHGVSPSMPIDHFLRTLAEDQGNRAIGVVLSGAASDGALGAKAIKAEGGVTFAQDDSAQFQSMPRAAVAAAGIDFVLAPEEIARELMRIARHPYFRPTAQQRLPESGLITLFTLIKASHDVDFTHYKPSTVERRIRRRMALHKIDDLARYVTFVRETPGEIEELYNDLLIRVTGFFRDPEVFETLKKHILPALLDDRDPADAIRVWVPGCATGEEVYSLAIAILEYCNTIDTVPVLQVFGTDISDDAVDRARTGIYPENIVADLSSERLRRFFTRVDGQYRVAKSVRDCCIFARQDLTKDPPFSKLDLISCRNVMIYLDTILQRKVMSIFHYALRPEGYLLLGSSETIGTFGDLFGVVDRKHKMYKKNADAVRKPIDFKAAPARTREEAPRRQDPLNPPMNIFREADRVLLSRYVPAGVLINSDLEILQFRGRTSRYLEPAPGTATFNVLKMAREGLLADLRAAIHIAMQKGTPARREDIPLKWNGSTALLNIEVVPFLAADRQQFLVVTFEEVPQSEHKRKTTEVVSKKEERQVSRLKRELDAAREYLQSIIEEQEAMNEELRSANEEIQSSNEELQSTNEELETAKEELQSSNEELITLNEELENRNRDLAQVNNDLLNLLGSIDIPVVMLDNDLRIRRFNSGAQRALDLLPSDVGRSMPELKTTLVVEALDQLLIEVIDTLSTRELEVKDRTGRSYLMRVRPYKTTENRIEGAVLVLIDLDELRVKRGKAK